MEIILIYIFKTTIPVPRLYSTESGNCNAKFYNYNALASELYLTLLIEVKIKPISRNRIHQISIFLFIIVGGIHLWVWLKIIKGHPRMLFCLFIHFLE
jgi:hypothetical protein